MKRAAVVLVFLAACASPKPQPVTPVPAPKPAKEGPRGPESRAPLFVEYVAVERRWVTKYVPDGADDVKAWAASMPVPPTFRWLLAKAENTTDAAAKKKAQSFLDRLKKGETLSKIAGEASDDPGSRDHGGEYSADKVEHFVPEVIAAFNALKPGETSPIVKTPFGYAVIRKAPPSDEELARLYRIAKSGDLTKRLGAELTTSLRKNANPRAAIADAVQSVLGEAAVADPDRPRLEVVDRERLKDVHHLSAAVKAGLSRFADGAHPGDMLDTPASDEEMVVVARAVAAAG